MNEINGMDGEINKSLCREFGIYSMDEEVNYGVEAVKCITSYSPQDDAFDFFHSTVQSFTLFRHA